MRAAVEAHERHDGWGKSRWYLTSREDSGRVDVAGVRGSEAQSELVLTALKVRGSPGLGTVEPLRRLSRRAKAWPST
ncbi:hypothetical protein CITRIK5_70133 [Citricoccus sp. K5]|nr:hypothetical protein CITRIK5_70133 [Citricoccus sp. K5]